MTDYMLGSDLQKIKTDVDKSLKNQEKILKSQEEIKKQLAQIVGPQDEDGGIGADGVCGKDHHTLVVRNNTRDQVMPGRKIQVIVKGDDVLNGPQESGYMSSTPTIEEFSCRSESWEDNCGNQDVVRKVFDVHVYLVMDYVNKKTKYIGLKKIPIAEYTGKKVTTDIRTREDSERVYFMFSHDMDDIIGSVSQEEWDQAEK